MVASQTQKEFVPGQGYTEADWDAVDFPEMTDEELANARPARAVLPPAFFEAVEEYRNSRSRPSAEKATTVGKPSG
ncbi:hypothetical protein CFBP7129_02345 [Agrobacterium tumefaciens]|uniref:Uncharacterized protein n=1 Tax=Agrobacterium tumefaciens TaxID=358 RepID=A0A4D7Y8B3_AGRTU|nr:hypothetical protein CFBP7129_02345 [Agrobacterium tumefaciens]